ncbi:MAG: GldG family protein [Candidatus Anammoxibacter sp.]
MVTSNQKTASLSKTRGRKALIFANVTFVIIVAIIIFGFVSYINGRNFIHFDFTANKKFSLSSKTKNILKNLDKPVTITILFNPSEIFYTQIKDVLDEYAYMSKLLTVKEIDPLRNRTKAEELAKQLKLESLELNSIVIQSGERSKHVLQKEVIEKSYPFAFIGEEVFTSAVLSVVHGKQTGIFFTIGHGERAIDDFDRAGLSSAVESFKRDNFKVIPLDLLTKKEIPISCKVLVIAGPTKAFSTEEINIISEYLKNNGKLLVMLEPALGPNIPSGLKPLLADYGVKLRDDVVIYNKVNMPMYGSQLVAEVYVSKDEYKEHAITKGMTDLTTVFFGACGIETTSSHSGVPFGNKKFKVSPLAMAPDRAWGEVTIEDNVKPQVDPEKDLTGPISLAVAVEPIDKDAPDGTRIVVFTDVDFVANEFIRKPGNQDLVRNSINWLAKKETQLGIAGKPPEYRVASFSPGQMKIIFWLSLGGLPVVTIITGGIVWWRRRR